MGLNIFNAKLSDISNKSYLFLHYDYFRLKKLIAKDMNILTKKVAEYFEIISGYAFSSKDYIDDGVKLIRISDISKYDELLYNDMAFLPLEYKDKYQKYLLKYNDIVIGMTGDGKVFKTGIVLNIKGNILLNQRVGLLRIKKDIKYNQKFFYYLTKLDIFQNQIKIVAMGKTQKNVSPFDLLKIQIPNTSLSLQNKVIQKIEPIEKEIEDLKSQKQEHLEIINDVFADEFNYSKTLWKEFGKGMTAGTQKSNDKNMQNYTIKLSCISQNNIFRISSRFHNPITAELNRVLYSKKIIIMNNIVNYFEKGIQPKYSDNGDVDIIKIWNLKNNYIDFENSEKIDYLEFKNIKKTKKLKKDDIIICCTGKVSLGKVDILEKNVNSITTVDNYSININKELYNPQFLTYFLRSILGTYQIERDYTGTTNQIHLYWNEIGNFKIPDFTLKYQQQIVDKIKIKIDTQKDIDKQIENKQDKISKIIEDCING